MTDIQVCVFYLIGDRLTAITVVVVPVDDIFAVGQKERCDRLLHDDLNRTIPIDNLLGELKW